MVKTKGQMDALTQLVGAQTDFIAQRLKDSGITYATFAFQGDDITVTAYEPFKNDTFAVHSLKINDRHMDEYGFVIIDNEGNPVA